jgi:hypothetical protein
MDRAALAILPTERHRAVAPLHTEWSSCDCHWRHLAPRNAASQFVESVKSDR